MTDRRQYRANWMRARYARLRKEGRCIHCLAKSKRWLCATCIRVRKMKLAAA